MSFWTRRKCYDASKITLKYDSIFRRRVKNVHMTHHRTYIPFKLFSGALKIDWMRPKYFRLFLTLRKYVRLFWTHSK